MQDAIFHGISQRTSADAIIISKAAADYMGLENAIGQTLTDVDEFGKHKWTRTIVGVVDDIIMESPYEPVMQAIFLPKDEPLRHCFTFVSIHN